MTTTLSDLSAKKKPEPSAEVIAAKESVRLAKEQGLSLTGPGGLLKQFTKNPLQPELHRRTRSCRCSGQGPANSSVTPLRLVTVDTRPGGRQGGPQGRCAVPLDVV